METCLDLLGVAQAGPDFALRAWGLGVQGLGFRGLGVTGFRGLGGEFRGPGFRV